MFTRIHFAVVLLLLFTSAPGLAETWQHESGTLNLEETPERVIALNWAATETLLLLGVTPVGIADKGGYDVWVKQPELPEEVVNVGARVSPSLEAIAELKPDLIVTSSEMAPAARLLEQIAPTYLISVYKEGSQPFDKAKEMLTTLGEMLDRQAEAQAVLADLNATLQAQRKRLESAGLTERPIALVNFLDNRHVRIYAPNGLYQSTLNALGLDNAWSRPGNYWGFSVVGLEAIAPFSESRLVVISPTPPGLKNDLPDSPFWTYLEPVLREQVYTVEPIWPFGGVYPIKRLATLLTDSLLAGGSDNVR